MGYVNGIYKEGTDTYKYFQVPPKKQHCARKGSLKAL